MKRKLKIRWSSLTGFVVSVGSLLSHPEILALLPEKWAIVGSALGIAIQTLSKPIVHEETVR